jgi:phosphoribosylglycinamide formyltransferase-1
LTATTRLGILVSGRGSNLRNLVDRGYRVMAVATNRPSCGAAAFARERGLALGEFPQKHYLPQVGARRASPSIGEERVPAEARDRAMCAWLVERGVELVVNAGYDRILSPAFVAAFRERIINIHPSLLPAFGGGMDAVERALARGVKITGCTAHLVTDEVDGGPILLQAAVPILENDSHDTLLARIQAEEHRILPEAIELIAERIQEGAPLRQ